MINFNQQVTRVRNGQRQELVALDLGDQYSFPLTADVTEGDIIERELPNGTARRVRLTDVRHLDADPFGTGGGLEHIQAFYSAQLDDIEPRGAGPVFNIQGTNVQLSTGHHSTQSMHVSAATTELRDSVESVIALVSALGLDVAPEMRERAIAGIDEETPDLTPLQGMCDWVREQMEKAGAAAVVPALTMLFNTLLVDGGHWVQSLAR